jgi:hypothetical protein
MTTKKSLVLGSLIFNLTLTSGAWAKPPQLTYALDQAQAAKASYQAEDTQQASAHSFGDRSVEYRSIEELKAAIREVEADLARATGKPKTRQIRATTQKGF